MADKPAILPDELYVGYLPVPARQQRFLRIAVPAALWAMAIASFVIARSQRDPGPAVWDDAKARTFTGIVAARPYPMLYADDRGDGNPGILLLVEVGKHGGQRAAPVDGKRATISGWLIHRDGRQMLEMEPGDAAIKPEPAGRGRVDLPPARSLGRVTLRGEIVDSKCFVGVMKPGEGKTHKECATLCISGGLPPMLITRDAGGTTTYYLLTDPSGGPLDRAAFPLIADPVELSGDLELQGGLLRLRVAAHDIHRL